MRKPTSKNGRTLRWLLSISTNLLALSGWIFSAGAQVPPPVLPNYAEHQDLSYYLDALGTRHAIEKVEHWRIRRDHIVAHLQSVMGPLPGEGQHIPLDVQFLEEVRIGGLRRIKLSYASEPNDRVPAYLFLPEVIGNTADSKPRPAVLCLHQTIDIGKDEPAGLGGSPDLQYALHLAKQGFVTLAPDYPSFGEHAFDFTDGRFAYQSGSMKAIWDNMRGVDLLQSLPEVDGERIGCLGHSLGGHNAMFTSVFEPRIRVVVSNCGFTRFHKYYAGNLKGWSSPRYMPKIAAVYGSDPDRVPFDFTEIVAALAPRPFLACAPLQDSNFEVSGVRDAIIAARPIYELMGDDQGLEAYYPECAHAFPEAARSVAYGFLKKHLGDP